LIGSISGLRRSECRGGLRSAGDHARSSEDRRSGPPIITKKGDNPARVYLGATSQDLGAQITAPQQDLNLGLITLVDGATTTQIMLDTAKPRRAHHSLHRHRPQRPDGQRIAHRDRERSESRER
jgi:hypothetical protein